MISSGIILGVAIDWLVGEPKRWHPLVGFGRLANSIEERVNVCSPGFLFAPTVWTRHGKLCGVVAVMLLCLPLPLVLYSLFSSSDSSAVVVYLLNAFVLYLAIGHRSLWDHIRPITEALFRQDDESARHHTAMIVSRDPDALNIEVSAIESVLENGSDAIFGAIFWFAIAGGAGAVFYRFVNTLDAMWGYRTARYHQFGWAAARLDDALNYIPARLTALTYALLSDCANALRCWKEQASAHASPNGGPVIAAGAGGLGILLGGPTRYHGIWHDKPVLGRGRPPTAVDIQRAMRLVSHSLMLWMGLIISAEIIWFFFINDGSVK
ncbi:adenosylcobinamide-phosphate synthase CbiB [Neptunomonas antarctica]|uniref:Cobalamin biosynthesis protein CobD n=1 Tax=Neptunomonas antarctica TaxID=619304 RepID=A0A1N7NES2_9GAMM|nr:adenosylcobinamide-phosphate synthase CbiB [Neptunomonas antarctica]SIS96796.1 adenosylcobinamide-phosphate synthase [Neptunomonas antarctica]